MSTSKKPRKKQSKTAKKAGVSGGTPVLPDFRTMESYLRALGGEAVDEALDRAQALIYDAWEIGDGRRRMALARRALKISPLCADAYVILAKRPSLSLKERRDLFERGVKAGEMTLGPEGFEEFAGHFWGFLETRPYMRARAGLAQTLWAEGRHDEAIAHCREMLDLNPGDNQGIRYIVAAWLLRMGDDAGLEKLLKQHGDDASAFMLYTQALFAFRKGGDSKKAKELAEEAWHSNTHIPAALAGTKKIKDPGTGYHTIGGEDEAVYYIDEYGSAWRETPGAIEWLAEATRNLKPRAHGSNQLH